MFFNAQSACRFSFRVVFLLSVCTPSVFTLSMGSVSANATETNIETETNPEYQLLKAAADTYIIPLHQEFEQDIHSLEIASKAFCKHPEASTFAAAQKSWSIAMASWSALAPISFGPIDDNNLLWRFQFWPDDLNLVHRKFKSRVSGSDPLINSGELAGASVAIQGLSALEYLLFDTETATLSHYQSKPHLCQILQNTAYNLLINAQQLSQQWQGGYSVRWLDSQREKEHPGYFTQQIESLFSGLVMALESIENQKLAKPLSLTKGERSLNPWQLESWRSQTSLDNIRATLASSFQLYTMDKGLSWYLVQTSEVFVPLDKKIRQQFQQSITLASEINVSAFQLLEQNQPESLEALYQNISQLHKLLESDYSKATLILFKFNAKDGD